MQEEPWTLEIKPKSNLFDVDIKEIWRYRDLLWIMAKRNLQASYKQTVLGYGWFFIGPILTTIMYTIVFGNIAGIPTDGVPKPLFYLAGTSCWGFFVVCFNVCAGALSGYAHLYTKVYFPRLIPPLAAIISSLVPFAIELFIFFCFYVYFVLSGSSAHFTWAIMMFPLLMVMLAGLGVGLGLFCSSISTKYRDLAICISWFMKLVMYATPVIYPLSTIHNPHIKTAVLINPLSGILEWWKYGFLGEGSHEWWMLGYSFAAMVVFLILGVIIFNRAQRTFADTV